MNIFEFRERLIKDYASYIQSFIRIRNPVLETYVQKQLSDGILWPEPLIQLNPLFEPGALIDDLVLQGVLHRECSRIFRRGKSPDDPKGQVLRLYKHQEDALRLARSGASYVLTTGTGSGKSLAYIIPIVDTVLRTGTGHGIQAIVVYPMNALANSQSQELEKFLHAGYPSGQSPVTYARYTGQESREERERIIAHPPDILLTNYVMLELMLTRSVERPLLKEQVLQFLVLDELHTYRGRQGADVALLVRRVKDRLAPGHLQCVGTSATLAGEGSYEEQRQGVAIMAQQIFGVPVQPHHSIGETLMRSTATLDEQSPAFIQALRERIQRKEHPPRDYTSFVNDPLSVWLESTFGVTTKEGRLVRRMPQSISAKYGSAGAQLHTLTGLPLADCIEIIQEGLLAGYECSPNPETGRPPFAFRLHQFISKGDTIYSSLEPERYVTLQQQQFVPGDRERVLLPLVFCRECGQEYYCVLRKEVSQDHKILYSDRRFGYSHDEEGTAGFLYYSPDSPWPTDEDMLIDRLPEEWLEEFHGTLRVRYGRRKDLPLNIRVRPDGVEVDQDARDAHALDCHFLPAPFRFCLHCGVSYNARQRNDFSKLASLSSEGRSTATTILSLSAILTLREEAQRAPYALPPKMLSFTDNRQDASLQAGHFNDFIDVGLLRSALYQAVKRAGNQGIAHEELTQKVFEALNLPLSSYAVDPNVKYQALAETNRALRTVLGYRLYRDLKRGWRITSPNLEQCGLLVIDYRSLEELCQAEEEWSKRHTTLVSASPETRYAAAKVLLDYLRRELAIKVDYLAPSFQESMQQQSSQRLIAPWALDENETREYATTLFARSRRNEDDRSYVYLSPRGGFGQYLRRASTFPNSTEKLKLPQTAEIIKGLLGALQVAGLVEQVVESRQKDGEENTGYQLPASALVWRVGNGTEAYYDPITVPQKPREGKRRTNTFFVDFYQTTATKLEHLEAREHTAQVPNALREEREQRFRAGSLPILYCSPTMELGVDIAELNVVNMRNIPPTPANYAQRSGRAGRSGQPALVFSYSSTGSSHDQYFFKRPELMVSGAVTPPRLDLANEDLVRAHVYAIWLAETGQSLGHSLKDLLDVSGDEPTLEIHGSVRYAIEHPGARKRARAQAVRVLEALHDELHVANWHADGWLDMVLEQVVANFDRTCDRWRGLYRAALAQSQVQGRIVRDASRSADDKKQAERLRGEAESQLKLLTDIESPEQSDFYSYRYFASEGFLPGYNFPRLPLSAFIPARRTRQRDEYLSRPRFLAISEFGPRAIVYHEGSRYLINRVILSPTNDRDEITTRQAKQCQQCGYLHPLSDGVGADICERCGTLLSAPLTQLFRLQNVATKRRDKINSDEEERMRQGFELRTAVRFTDHNGHPATSVGEVKRGDEMLARLTYGHAATLWRINLGWLRRKQHDQYGFVLDVERGYWAKDEQVQDEQGDPLSARTMRVIPYVEDQRNCLLFDPGKEYDAPVMASLQAALKSAMQVRYQLEDNELAAEPLPDAMKRSQILFYEASEGGAGVLRRLLDEPNALRDVAREALRLCHFDPETGDDVRRAEWAEEECEAACYSCLMTYANQRDHKLLDRQSILPLLRQLAESRMVSGPTSLPRSDHMEFLLHLCGSELEKSWLRYLDERGHRLPSTAQVFIEAGKTRPDFLYQQEQVAIYVDGPYHEFPERQVRDAQQQDALEDLGYTVVRFRHNEEWATILAHYPSIFGRPV